MVITILNLFVNLSLYICVEENNTESTNPSNYEAKFWNLNNTKFKLINKHEIINAFGVISEFKLIIHV